ncbi:hypothetical protein ACFXMF_43655 [Embleya sp. NPDC059213]|uniref:hypothetical protein n=1 Tax=Embleya sp. NPDC059213 TaxID=3346771 RepID=UPI0036B38488
MPTDEPRPCCHDRPEPVSVRPRRRRWAYTGLGTLLLAVVMGIGEEAGHLVVSDALPAVRSIVR